MLHKLHTSIEHTIEIQNYNFSRPITSSQILTIPMHTSWFCITPTKLENLFSSDCIFNPGWSISTLDAINKIQVGSIQGYVG